MSSRVFQSIVLQMKECTDRVIGVIDDQGTVVSCNQLTWIGEKWEGAASALNVNESAVVIYGDKTFKPLVSRGSHFDYAAFVQGSDEQAKLICSMVTVALNSAKGFSDLRGLRAEAFNVRAGARMAINERAARAGFGPVASRLRAGFAQSRARFLRGDYNDLDFGRYVLVFAYRSPAAMTMTGAGPS